MIYVVSDAIGYIFGDFILLHLWISNKVDLDQQLKFNDSYWSFGGFLFEFELLTIFYAGHFYIRNRDVSSSWPIYSSPHPLPVPPHPKKN